MLLTLLFVSSISQAQNFTVIHSFTGGPDGASPLAGLSLDRGGNLYGTAYLGGTNDNGTVFRLKRSGSNWTFEVLHTFAGSPDGANPEGRITLGVGKGRHIAPVSRQSPLVVTDHSWLQRLLKLLVEGDNLT